MKKIFALPSAIEENELELTNVADSFIDGIKIIRDDGRSYIIGALALTEGISPHKFLNSSSEDIDYRILSLASLILATRGKYLRFNLTIGFPYSTFQSYQNSAIEFLQGRHTVSIDTRTFGGDDIERVNIVVENVNVMPELEGCIKAVRKGENAEKDNFFITSLGFGTFEAALSTSKGTVNRTIISTKGINYAQNILEKQLQKKYYLNLLTEQQIEKAFQRGIIIIGRKKVDIRELRDKALRTYYTEVVSPSLRKKFSDEDFMDTSKIYLVGGGACYDELVKLFKSEFDNIVEVIVPRDPNYAAGTGYCLNSLEITSDEDFDSDEQPVSVGLDIGNASTVVVVDDASELKVDTTKNAD